MPTPDAPRMAIVGAGPSGLAALRALTAAGIDAVAFERGARIGGVWTLEDRPTAAYRSLHLITSRAADRVRRAADARRHARLPEPRRGRAATSRTTPSASACATGSGSGAEVRARAAAATGGGWELELEGGERERADAARRRQRPQRACRRGPIRPTRASSPAASCTRSTTTTPSDFRGQRRAGGRDGQQRDGHRHRPLARRRAHAAVGAPRQLGDPQAAARASPPTR